MTKDYFLAKYCQHGFEGHILDKSECETKEQIEIGKEVNVKTVDKTEALEKKKKNIKLSIKGIRYLEERRNTRT